MLGFSPPGLFSTGLFSWISLQKGGILAWGFKREGMGSNHLPIILAQFNLDPKHMANSTYLFIYLTKNKFSRLLGNPFRAKSTIHPLIHPPSPSFPPANSHLVDGPDPLSPPVSFPRRRSVAMAGYRVAIAPFIFFLFFFQILFLHFVG